MDDKQKHMFHSHIESSPELCQQFIRAVVGSEYVVESCCREPSLLLQWLMSDAPFSKLTPIKIIDAIETACSDDLNCESFDRLLRHLRRRFMTALYWRDINQLAGFDEVTSAMTTMAETFVQQALDFHYKNLVKKNGVPIGRESKEPQPMLVLGMGKLGGGELNVSSDIDLIFTFPEGGVTQALTKNEKIKSIDNQQFFAQLGQKLIKSLNEMTADGFVFRVDMRLRPYGQSGSLVSNFSALEHYYESQGRAWERFAAVKARVVACTNLPDKTQSIHIERKAQEALYAILKPFVYRQYVDFAMVESLRKLKLMIAQEVKRKGMQNDIKLGAGGIREVEFIAQSFQLIRGGRDTRLQEKNLLLVLDVIASCGYLDEDIVASLKEAYLFLRKTEHMIQAFQDTQTQRLPSEDKQIERLAWLIGNQTTSDFLLSLNQHRSTVNREFKKIIADTEIQDDTVQKERGAWQLLWSDLSLDAAPISFGDESDDTLVLTRLKNFKNSRNVTSLSSHARESLDEFIPLLLQSLYEKDDDEKQGYEREGYEKEGYEKESGVSSELNNTLGRLLEWLESIVTRTSYLSLMLENPQALKHLTRLFASSAWVAQTLTQIPSLLDELLSPSTLYSLPEKTLLRDELRQRLLRLDHDDVEMHMEVLRYFRLAHNLQVAACEIEGSLPLMKVSDYLTFTAEVILEQVFRLAWSAIVARHGYPPNVSDEAPHFLVVGYGKLGGIEMSYSSDLDLVFIYDVDAQAMTDGQRPIDSQTFYTRLGQKMIHLLNTRTLSGQLYEVDMRLRPSGNSGLLVSSFSAYSRYQLNDAWVWEHQALVRARPIVGDLELTQRFTQLRRDVLGQTRGLSGLRVEVVKMREKMRKHLGTASKSKENTAEDREFHLKQDVGGIVDIE
ncbi:MAG: bifunctional [glutamate--ammonia ligase]-adenylyl-L-tyrosine phosphorylase/[glutamate--ammonia-ligase] adenylyltransferase, partial [Cellvibrionaceae bacterium]